jgi:Tol biopolymer transport system component
MRGRFAIVAAVAWLLVVVGGAGAQQAKLIFQGNDGYSICDPDGKNVARMTLPLPKRFGDKFSRPVRSPDGSKIAFYGSPEKGDGFFVMDADGTNARRLTDDPDSYHDHLSWFPDGKHLVCQQFEADTGTRIWLLNPDGTNPTALTREKLECVCPSVSPDGKRIALVQGEGKNRGVAVMDADGKNLQQIHKLQNKPYAGDVAWSPDGKRLLFNDAGDLYSMKPDGSDVQQLTRVGNVSSLAWSPDGKLITFIRPQSDQSLKFDVHVMNADGSNDKAVVKDLNGFCQPGWWVPGK